MSAQQAIATLRQQYLARSGCGTARVHVTFDSAALRQVHDCRIKPLCAGVDDAALVDHLGGEQTDDGSSGMRVSLTVAAVRIVRERNFDLGAICRTEERLNCLGIRGLDLRTLGSAKPLSDHLLSGGGTAELQFELAGEPTVPATGPNCGCNAQMFASPTTMAAVNCGQNVGFPTRDELNAK